MAFKVEIRTSCKICGGKITNKRFRTFCSAKCRNRSYRIKYKDYYAEYQRNKADSSHTKPSSNRIQCMICGRWYVQVGSHIVLRHNITAREYRKMYGFDVKRGQVPGWYRELKAEQTFENGTIKNLKKGKKFWFKPGDERAGKYERSEETMHRLKHLRKFQDRKKVYDRSMS